MSFRKISIGTAFIFIFSIFIFPAIITAQAPCVIEYDSTTLCLDTVNPDDSPNWYGAIYPDRYFEPSNPIDNHVCGNDGFFSIRHGNLITVTTPSLPEAGTYKVITGYRLHAAQDDEDFLIRCGSNVYELLDADLLNTENFEMYDGDLFCDFSAGLNTFTFESKDGSSESVHLEEFQIIKCKDTVTPGTSIPPTAFLPFFTLSNLIITSLILISIYTIFFFSKRK